MLLADALLGQMARRQPARALVADGTRTFSYRDVDERSTRLAAALRKFGGSLGDRVALLLGNRAEYAEAVFGVGRAGLAAVPLNPRLGAAQLRTVIEDCRPVAILAEPGLAVPPGTAPVIELGDEYERNLERATPDEPVGGRDDMDAWLVGYTSGTTGRPKGALLSHRAKSVSALVEAAEFATSAADVALVNTPLFHVHAIVHLLTQVVAGGSVLVQPSFDAEETLRLVASGTVTELSMVPTMYQALVEAAPNGARPPRLARCTGAAMGGELRTAFAERFAAWPLHLFYGATEAGAISNLRPEHRPAKDGSIGLPFLGVELEIRSDSAERVPAGVEGEVFLRSPAAYSGYLGREDVYGDWLSLGDLGSVDADGFLTLRGRRGERITTGGEKVVPEDVESVVLSHPAVRAAAVFGVPDRYWGEAVWAAVELSEPLIEAEPVLRSHCERSLAPHQLPKRYLLLPSIPRNAFGKVDRSRLRSLALEAGEKEAGRDGR
jgi:acyl-CoA synthetase (AMP-forming)/AMP-acid ligase II